MKTMQGIILWFFISIFICNCSQANNELYNHQLIYNDVFVKYQGNGSFSFIVKSKVKNIEKEKTKNITYILNPLIQEIKVSIDGNYTPFKTSINNDLLNLQIDYEINNEQIVEILFEYTIRINKNYVSLGSENNISYILSDSYSFPMIQNSSHVTYSPYKLTAEVPLNFTIINSGKLKESIKLNENRKKITFEETRNDLPFLVMGEFSLDPFEKNNKKLNIYIPNYFKILNYDIKKTFETVYGIESFYSNLWGKLNTNECNIVFLGRRGGYSRNNVLLLNSSFITEKEKMNDLITHEIAHFWWGNKVHFENSFLHESLAEYSRELFRRNYDLKNYHISLMQSQLFSPSGSNNFYKLSPRDTLYQLLAYNKAALIIQQIENSIGLINVQKEFKNLIKRGEQGIITLDNFIDHFNDYPELKNILSYYYTGGLEPDYFIEEKDGWFEIGATNNNFDIKLPVQIIYQNGKSNTDTVIVHKSKEKIQFRYLQNKNIGSIILDPEGNLIQSDITNDTWRNTRSYRLLDKLNNDSNKIFTDFFDSVFASINKSGSISYSYYSDNTIVQDQLKEIFPKMINLKYELIISQENFRFKRFRLILKADSNKTSKLGFIDGFLTITNDNIKIEKIIRTEL